jgi:uncharacterized phiE125 gp8 family phage protein
MITERTTTPAGLPFDVSELAQHVRVDDAGQIAEATRQAAAAAREVELGFGLALLDQAIRVTLPNGPGRELFPLPIAPLIDPLGVTITLDGAAYDDFAVITGLRPAVHFTSGKPCGLVVITYDSGFGNDATEIPADLRHAILDQAAALFDGRGLGDGKITGMSPQMARIAARYRRVAV